MTAKPTTLGDLFDEEEARLREQPDDSPEVKLARETQSRREWQRGIELGWYNEDGTLGPNADQAEDDDEEEE